MRPDLKFDFLLMAVILSAALHVGLMFLVAPRVMTHATIADVGAERRRGPMKITPVATAPEPVTMSAVQDEIAERPAPAAEDALAAIFAPPPDAEVAASVSQAPEVPRILDRIHPTGTAELLPVVQTDAPVIQKRMMVESTAPTATSEAPASEQIVPSATLPALVSAPQATAAPTLPVEQVAAETRPTFKPANEVYAEVDEEVVRREKEAVRDLMTVANANDMNEAVSISLVSAYDKGATYFKATVRPRPRLPIVPKDVVILIDASGSVGDTRLTSCREAARKILRSCVNSGDRFNLVAFRNRFSYAFLSWQDCTKTSYAAADGWLDGLAAHGRTDVFSTIRSVLTLPRDPARPLIALVVTDGDANVGVSDTRAIISQFTKLNDGLVSIYMYGIRRSGNRELIDMLTHGNRGESLMYGGTRKNASGEGIESLSERFRDPVLSDLRVVFPSTCPATAYPTLLRNLYRGDAVEIIGRVPGTPRTIEFSLRGLAGPVAYEGFFRLPVTGGDSADDLVDAWQAEQAFDRRY